VIGLLINLSGIFFLSPSHHAHQHDEHCHHKEGESHSNENVQGVFLHMVADTIASVSVIISTLLIKYFKFYFADALCSIFISIVIIYASFPLILHSSKVLLLNSPSRLDERIETSLNKIKEMKGILNIYNTHFWSLNSDSIVGSFNVKIEDDLNEQEVLTKITDEFSFIQDLTIQIEKKKLLLSNINSNAIGGNHFSV
jgi:solute carrier family 30 (zinc transporter), member 5/7